MSFTDFVVFPPGHGRSVTDFWGWDAHEARLRCPDDMSGDIGGSSARRALKPKFDEPTQTMVTAGILPFRENSLDSSWVKFSLPRTPQAAVCYMASSF